MRVDQAWIVLRTGYAPSALWSGREQQSAQPYEGAIELVFPGIPLKEMPVMRRVFRMSLPTGKKKRRRRVFVVATGSPRPMRLVQRARAR